MRGSVPSGGEKPGKVADEGSRDMMSGTVPAEYNDGVPPDSTAVLEQKDQNPYAVTLPDIGRARFISANSCMCL